MAVHQRSRQYSRVVAADVFLIAAATYLLEANQQEQIAAIRAQLEVLENGGSVIDV